MGVVLLLMVLLLLAVVWTASKMTDAKNKLARQQSGRAEAWYIATGTVCGHRQHVVSSIFLVLSSGILAKKFICIMSSWVVARSLHFCRTLWYMTRCNFLFDAWSRQLHHQSFVPLVDGLVRLLSAWGCYCGPT